MTTTRSMCSGEYKCGVCVDDDAVVFSSFNELRAHNAQTHAYKHECEECGQMFNRPVWLKRHMKQMHESAQLCAIQASHHAQQQHPSSLLSRQIWHWRAYDGCLLLLLYMSVLYCIVLYWLCCAGMLDACA